MPTMIKCDHTKNLKKLILKWGEIPVDDNSLKGTIKIVNHRKYQFTSEIDIVFEGKILVIVNARETWIDYSFSNNHKVSKIKLNRYLRRKCYSHIKHRLNYFDILIRHNTDIKKINWK
jgi:hypothetical protein